MAEIKTVLTDEQIFSIAINMDDAELVKITPFARAIEAAVLSALTPPTWRCCEKMVEQGAGNMVCCGEPIEVAVLSANAGKVDEWLPIDSAPKDRKIIVGRVGLNSCAIAKWDDGLSIWRTDALFFAAPTHWQPIPAAPFPTQQAIDAGRQG